MWMVVLGLAMAADGPKASDLSWLSGTWAQEHEGQRVEETWTAVQGGTLFGVSRTTKGTTTVFHEFLRIEPVEAGLTYVALPKGAPAETPFVAVGHGAAWVRFENPTHDFPTSIRYERDNDVLKVEVRGPDGKGFDLAMVSAGWAFASPPATPEATCDALILEVTERVAGDIETLALAQWFRYAHPEATEDTDDPQQAKFSIAGCRFEFLKGMSLSHGVHVHLEPPRALPTVLERTACATMRVEEGFVHDGIGPTGIFYAQCYQERRRIQLTLHEPTLAPGTHDLSAAPTSLLWIQRTGAR